MEVIVFFCAVKTLAFFAKLEWTVQKLLDKARRPTPKPALAETECP